MSEPEAFFLLKETVVLEEKIDGANLGISIDSDGALRVQNRGQYLIEPFVGQFEKLADWVAPRADGFFDALSEDLILFGEWCAAAHSIRYDRLSDWFLVFDVYDRRAGRFLSTGRRDTLARQLGLAIVPRLFEGHITLDALKEMVMAHPSAFRDGPLEGIVVRRESAEWLTLRAKLVRPDFVQGIVKHWRRRVIEWNRIDWTRSPAVGSVVAP